MSTKPRLPNSTPYHPSTLSYPATNHAHTTAITANMSLLPKLTIFLLGLFLMTTQANPLGAHPKPRRSIGGVLICTNPNATGVCTHETYQLNKCYNLPDGLRNNAATFAPDPGNFFCYPYLKVCGGICTSPEGCTMGPVDSDYPHRYNLTAVSWDRFITSFDCLLK
ncbi:uncharacterized protein QC763_710860 [Podospora pseudopauciseta]|uniref:Uncharacterized protein n=1 Tax=Podospora pseudopauciseta TaxID=2093780 RepID=A0ABR0H2J2_9PEZI|nr:hypothetical protein QC763_710860 [Podospora pseudopauciseta]